MASLSATIGEVHLAAKHCGVSLIGFAVDALVLHFALQSGLQPAWARLISLLVAMHVTFVINGRHVFRCLDRSNWPRQWLGYMLANSLGNLCNYWIFVTLVSTHWRVIAEPYVALGIGSVGAWVINFLATRWLVFGAAMKLLAVRAKSPRARDKTS
jgi:putative flippase GtrA